MRNPDRQTRFSFKQFEMSNCRSAMKIGTDGVLLGAWAIGTPISSQSDKELRIMDVGSGTGLIALMLAQRFPKATIVGVECDRDAAEEGADNFAGSPWHENLQMVHADFNTIAQESTPESFDAVVSNPPFFTNGAHAPDMQRLAARHEGTLNLESLTAGAARLLHPGGILSIVIPAEQRQRAEFAASIHNLHTLRICEVHTVASKPVRRVLIDFIKAQYPAPVERSTLCISDANGNKTSDYVRLVSPFYIRL